jgi:hypothetical protein
VSANRADAARTRRRRESFGNEEFDLSDTATPVRDYFRRDQRSGISPPDLSKDCTFAEHLVHARGKRTRYTSVSLDLRKIRDFGDTDYKLDGEATSRDGHEVVEHDTLIGALLRVVREGEKEDRLRAVQALRYATRRKEGLVSWCFDIAGVARKDLIAWAESRVQTYFTRI